MKSELRRVTTKLFAGCEDGALWFSLMWKSSMVVLLRPWVVTSEAVPTCVLVVRSKEFGKGQSLLWCFDEADDTKDRQR